MQRRNTIPFTRLLKASISEIAEDILQEFNKRRGRLIFLFLEYLKINRVAKSTLSHHCILNFKLILIIIFSGSMSQGWGFSKENVRMATNQIA